MDALVPRQSRPDVVQEVQTPGDDPLFGRRAGALCEIQVGDSGFRAMLVRRLDRGGDTGG